MIFHFNIVKSTSTSFDQNSIISDKINSITKNNSNSLTGLQSFLMTGSASFFGKYLYEAGFFSPLGILPENIKNLSPLAHESKKKLSKSSMINSQCNNFLPYKKKSIEYDLGITCLNKNNNNKTNSFEGLLKRYF